MTKGSGFSHLREIEEAGYRVTTFRVHKRDLYTYTRYFSRRGRGHTRIYIILGNSGNSGNLIPQLVYFVLLTRNSSNGESGNFLVTLVTAPARSRLPSRPTLGYPVSPPWRLTRAPRPRGCPTFAPPPMRPLAARSRAPAPCFERTPGPGSPAAGVAQKTLPRGRPEGVGNKAHAVAAFGVSRNKCFLTAGTGADRILAG